VHADAATAIGCQALKGSFDGREESRAASWGFVSTVDGRWGLLLAGPAAEDMIGKQITVSVDEQFLLVAVPHRLKSGLTMVGEFPADRMKLVVSARWLNMATETNSSRFHLRGSAEALVAAARCANAVREAGANRPPGTAPPAVPPTSRGASREPTPRISAGTGFYVSLSGHVLTNAHVVQGCSTIGIKGHGDASTRPVHVRASDTAQDLALLAPAGSSSNASPTVLRWRRDTRLGEQIAIFGFPYLGTLASSGTFTRGDVTALAGFNNNGAHFQLSAPVQPGNSGGPVVDERGHVVGIVVAKLNALTMAREKGDIPQNVNFAIKSAEAIPFMEAHGIVVAAADPAAPRLSGPDVAERLRDSAVLVMCTGSGEARR
jgi:S1-C subfamily serine protease